MSVNKSVYNGDPSVALSDIAASSKAMMNCCDQIEKLRLEALKLPHNSAQRMKKLEELSLENTRCDILADTAEQVYNLFRTIPKSGKRLEEAEQCFLKGDFEGMDAALPEKKITAEIYRLNKRAKNYLDLNWREVPLLLREKSYELLLKGLLFRTHVEDPHVSKKIWRVFTKALNASYNAHTLSVYGWCYHLCLNLEKAREFITDSISDKWMDKDLTEESRLFLLAEGYAGLAYVDEREDKCQAAIHNMQLALKYYSQLQEKNPAAYSAALSEALFFLAQNHAKTNAYAVSIVECEEALRIRRRLAAQHPQLHLHHVAEILMIKTVMHKQKEEHKEALICGDELIAIERKYLEFDRTAYRGRFAHSLCNVAAIYSYSDDGGIEKALQLQNEAIALYRELIDAYSPQNFQTEIAEALCQCGGYYYGLKQKEEAYRCIEEGVEHYFQAIRQLGRHRLERMDLWVADLSEWYIDDNQFAKAMALCQRWVDTLRPLEAESPEEFRESLRKSLTQLASVCYEQKNYEAFAPHYSEAIALARQIYSKDDGESAFVLGFLLAEFADYYTEIAPDREKALAFSLEAGKLLNPLRERDSRAEEAYQKARKSTRKWR